MVEVNSIDEAFRDMFTAVGASEFPQICCG